MIYKMTLKDSADEMTFDLLEVPIVDKDIEGAVDNVTLDGNQYTDYLWLKKQFIQKWSLLCDDEYTRLRGFYTRQFENADVPSYRLYYGDDIIRNSAPSGEYTQFSVEGVADGELSLTQIDGNATQTTYSGKNKVYLPSGTSTSNGITWTVTNETIKANGTATSNWSTPTGFITFPQPLPAGTYTFSIPSAIDKTLQLNLRDESEAMHDYNINAQSTSVTFTISFVATSFRFALRAGTGTTTDFTIPNQLQLEAGSSKTDFEPYVGGVPAPNPQFPMPIETVTGRQTVGVVGKNLLDPTNLYHGYYDPGVPSTLVANESYRTATIDNLPAGTYTFSCNLANVYLLRWAINDTSTAINGALSPFTFTTSSAGTFRICFRTEPTAVITASFDTMVESGSTATTYEPYNGQDYEINLGGTNLLPSTGTIPTGGAGVSFTRNSDGTYTVNGTASSNGFLEIGTVDFKQGQTYTISGLTGWTATTLHIFTTSETAFPIGHRLASYNGATTQTALDNETCDVRLYVYQGVTYNNVVVKPQIQLGSQATPYEPHTDYAYELCKIGTYQDRIYKDGEKWYVEKQVGKVVLDGSEAWGSANNNAYFYSDIDNFIRVESAAIVGPILSDYYLAKNRNDLWGRRVDYGVCCYETVSWVGIRNKDCADTNAFKTWLSTHPTTVYYPLATPTTTEITNEEVLEGLEALQNEAISVGQHNIYTDTPNALPTLTFDLTEYLSKSTTIIPETAVRLTLTDGGVINACGCRKDVQLTMRETIE